MAFVAAGLRTSGQTDARPAQLGGTGRRNARPRAVVVGSLVLWPLRPVPLSAVVLLVLERVYVLQPACVSPVTVRGTDV